MKWSRKQSTPVYEYALDIERRVELAIQLRDDMVTWGTPVEEWKKLWTMPVLISKTAKPNEEYRPVSVATQPINLYSREINTKELSNLMMSNVVTSKTPICAQCGSSNYHWTDGYKYFCDGCWSFRLYSR